MNKGLKDKILDLYNQGKNYTEIKEQLQCSKSTISYHLFPFKEIERLSKIGVKPEIKIKKPRTKINPYKINSKEYYKFRRASVKQILIDLKGGKCEICGYNKSNNALEFHHINPLEKEFNISHSSAKLSSLKEEASKCMLLCANCHREIHETFL